VARRRTSDESTIDQVVIQPRSSALVSEVRAGNERERVCSEIHFHSFRGPTIARYPSLRWSGWGPPSRSPQLRGWGDSLPGLARPSDRNARRTRCMVPRILGLKHPVEIAALVGSRPGSLGEWRAASMHRPKCRLQFLEPIPHAGLLGRRDQGVEDCHHLAWNDLATRQFVSGRSGFNSPPATAGKGTARNHPI